MKTCCKLGLLICLVLMLVSPACNRSEAPPPSLSMEELQPAIEMAFAKANSDCKHLVEPVFKALQVKDYSAAYLSLQMVRSAPGLTKEQSRIVSSVLLALNNALQEAESQGDQRAVQTLRLYRSTK